MGKRKTAAAWRVFLRGLARTGNARGAAAEAGMDVGTAYDRRIKDAGFAARWEAALRRCSGQALAKARPPSRTAMADKGRELVLRRTKHGDKLVRAAPGRWCSRVEETFFDGLERTGCVRAAAAAAGISTNALYARRKAYPEFAERWDEIEARASQQLPALLRTAAVASLGPDADAQGDGKRRGRGRLPRVNVDQAIRISQIKAPGAGAHARDRHSNQRASEAELTAAILKKLDILSKRQIAAGWTETEEGHMIPPGWVRAGQDGGGEGG